jgi:hypothetical protein
VQEKTRKQKPKKKKSQQGDTINGSSSQTFESLGGTQPLVF